MQVNRCNVEEILTSLEYNGVEKWSEKRLLNTIKKFPTLDPDDDTLGKHAALYDELVAAVEDEVEIKIIADDEEPPPKKKAGKRTPAPKKKAAGKKTPAKKTPAKSRKKAAPVEEDVDDDDDFDDDEYEEPAPKKKAGKKAPAKKAPAKKASGDKKKTPGVIASIVEFLQKASSKKPITKEDIVAKLTDRFPDRDPESMAKTVNVQIPTRLMSDKDIVVEKNEKGYWIAT